MINAIKRFSMLLCCVMLAVSAQAAETNNAKETGKVDPTTRSDAVIFKIHNVTPTTEDGIVNGCDFDVTLYNRTSINFRNFTLNLAWQDTVAEQFQFRNYMEKFLSKEELSQQKKVLGEEASSQPLLISVTVNAFGADKQITVNSHTNSERCYLMLNKASFSVAPCDIVRNIDMPGADSKFDSKDCSSLFQFVDVSNPEYFGKFKKLSATEIAEQTQVVQTQELSDIDSIIDKIVENLGASDQALNNIN